MEQRANIKFCYKIGKTCPETYRLLKQVYGEDCLSRSQVFEWYGRFKAGRENLMDNGKSGRPKTATTQQLIDNIRKLIDSDISVSIRTLASEFNVSKDTINNILRNNLNKRRICDRFVPYSLNADQELARIEHCKNILKLSQMNPNFIDTIVTGDETWCWKPEIDLSNNTNDITKDTEGDHGLGLKAPPSKQLQLQNKIKLICFYDSKGIVYKEFMMDSGGSGGGGGGGDGDEDHNKKCKNIDDTEMYLAILQRLCWNINCVRPEYKTNMGNWSLLQTNTNRITTTREFLMKNNITAIEHPALSPDLSPCDYYLFPKLKLQLRNNKRHQQSQIDTCTNTKTSSSRSVINDSQLNITNILDGIPKIELYESIHNLIDRATRCIETNGQYLEK